MLQLLESNSLPDVLSKSSFYDPIRWLCSCFCLSCTWFVLLTSPTNHTSCINCRYSVKLVWWRARPVVPELTETLLCSFSPDFSWLIPTPPHTHLHSPIWWKLICSVWVFTPLFRLRDFSLRCQLYIFSKCVLVIKEKGHTAGPQTTGEGRYKRYWNWLLIFPLLTACPLRQRAVSSLHTEHGGFPLIVGVLFIHVFLCVSLKKLPGSLVTSYLRAFSVQSWLVHCESVKVTS